MSRTPDSAVLPVASHAGAGAAEPVRLSLAGVLVVHPAIRTYRDPLFRRLGRAGAHFLFTSRNAPGSPPGEETARLLRAFPYKYIQAHEIGRGLATNISLQLAHTLRYRAVVFSSCTSIPALVCIPVLKLLRRRVLLFDELWCYQGEVLRYRLMYPYVRWIVRHCVDAVIAAGTKAREMYSVGFGVPEKALFVAFNTTNDLSRAEIDRQKAARIEDRVRGLAAGRKVLLYLGRVVEYKGLDVLIKAVSELSERPCVIVVGDGPFKRACEALRVDLGLADTVHFFQSCPADEAVYYYRCADLFVLPTRFLPSDRVNCESWGFTVNEAMSLEVPVVATTAVGAAYDLIRDGETGMIAVAGDVAALAERIVCLLGDDGRRRDIGRRGRERLMELCSEEQNAEAYFSAIAYATER